MRLLICDPIAWKNSAKLKGRMWSIVLPLGSFSVRSSVQFLTSFGRYQKDPIRNGSHKIYNVGWSTSNIQQLKPGWCFGTCFIFPNSWDDDPIWRTHIFSRGVETTNQSLKCKPVGFLLWVFDRCQRSFERDKVRSSKQISQRRTWWQNVLFQRCFFLRCQVLSHISIYSNNFFIHKKIHKHTTSW